jgi:hypothetical protein
MALFSECKDRYARKLLDTADIVREAIFRQLLPSTVPSFWRSRASAFITSFRLFEAVFQRGRTFLTPTDRKSFYPARLYNATGEARQTQIAEAVVITAAWMSGELGKTCDRAQPHCHTVCLPRQNRSAMLHKCTEILRPNSCTNGEDDCDATWPPL